MFFIPWRVVAEESARRLLVGGGGRRRFPFADFTRHRDPPAAGRAARRQRSYGVFAADTSDQLSAVWGFFLPTSHTTCAHTRARRSALPGGCVFFLSYLLEVWGRLARGWPAAPIALPRCLGSLASRIENCRGRRQRCCPPARSAGGVGRSRSADGVGRCRAAARAGAIADGLFCNEILTLLAWVL